MTKTSLLLGVVLLMPGMGRGASTPPATAPAGWIARLADPDPAVRQEAAEKLTALGPAARGALIAASNSAQPAIRSAAAAVLLRLPWYTADDPPPIREALESYGALSPADRRAVVGKLRMLARNEKTRSRAWETLIRLLGEEPNQDVRWSIAGALRGDRRAEDLKRLRDWPADDQTSPAMAVRGWAWLSSDRGKAIALFEQAAALEAAHPTQDGGTLDFVFETLVRHHLARREYDAAAAVLRQQAMRQAASDEGGEKASRALFFLFALHARHGPLGRFDDDLRQFAPALGRPELVYAMGQLYARAGQPMVARALDEAAFVADTASPEKRLDVAELLMSRGWYAPAERELNAVLAEAGPAPQYQALAHLKLKMIAVACGDDFNAARHLQSVLEQRLTVVQTNTLTGETTVLDNEALWAEVYWRYARAARTDGDLATANKRLDSLLALHPNDPDLAQELVPMLKELKRPQDAATVFAAAYRAGKAAVEARADDPEAMNNLAWLCARCNERLEEALALAERAVALSPDNAAYLDTAAEANFRLGRKAEAIRLEKRALELRPGNKFMREQLVRFSK